MPGLVYPDTVQLITAETAGLRTNRTDCSHIGLVRAIHVESYSINDAESQGTTDYRTHCTFDNRLLQIVNTADPVN